MAGLATADHRRRDFEVSKATQAGQRGDDRWHVTDLIFGQVTGFRARVGDKQTEWLSLSEIKSTFKPMTSKA
jgi:hypothetical protein